MGSVSQCCERLLEAMRDPVYFADLGPGSIIYIGGMILEVLMLGLRSRQRRLESGLPITLSTPLTADVSAGTSVVTTHPPPPPASSSSDSAQIYRDPHLQFAHGGRADFRGRDGALYNLFSAPRIAVNVKIEDASSRCKC